MTFQATQYILCCLGGLCTALHCTVSGWLCSADIGLEMSIVQSTECILSQPSTEYRVHTLLAFTDSLFFNIFLLAKRQITAFSMNIQAQLEYLGSAWALQSATAHYRNYRLKVLKFEGKDLNFSGLVSLGTSRSLRLPSFR